MQFTAQEVLAGLRAIEARAPTLYSKSTRAKQYVAVLERYLLAGRDFFDEEAEEVAAAIHEGFILAHIFGNLSTKPPNGFEKIYSKVLSAPFYPAREEDPRDFEAELFAAAIFRSLGYEVRLEEPDLGVLFDGCQIGIAVKRPRSWKKLGTRHDEGVKKQIRRTGREGLVFLDLSMALNRNLRPRGFPSLRHAELHVEGIRCRARARLGKLVSRERVRQLHGGNLVGGVVAVYREAIAQSGRVGLVIGWESFSYSDGVAAQASAFITQAAEAYRLRYAR